MNRTKVILLLVAGALVGLAAQALAVDYPFTETRVVEKHELTWSRDGDSRLNVIYYAPGGDPRSVEAFYIKADGTGIFNRAGARVVSPNAAFNTARSNYEAALDQLVSTLQSSGKLNPDR